MAHREDYLRQGQSNFIRRRKGGGGKQGRREGRPLPPDPEIYIDLERLHRLLDSLEGFSGQ
ncbi:MAG: hypothetical protein QNJ46_26125 [Leptolyngbyaceae cyanobacterium MO_188.B28]|nr:hypothetical protein [Leptolyngbyaceae cyanobacterium MO_188.B28]